MDKSKKLMVPSKPKTRKLFSEMIQQKREKRLMGTEIERVASDILPKITPNLSKNEITNRLKEMSGKICPSNSDKFQMLRRRDELLSKLRDLISAEPGARKITQGTCPDMCPEKERYMRDVQKGVHFYECDSRGQMAHEKMVKDYSRSAADQDLPLAHELRPLDTLQMTMDYLIFNIASEMPTTNTELVRWYDFLWSRTRQIRKDITQQMLQTESAVDLVEKCVRFHIFASFKLGSLDAEQFDDKINTENLSKSMQTLRHMYEDLAKSQRYCPNEPEFRSYDIILNLTDFNVHAQVLAYRPAVRESTQVQLALNLASTLQNNNFVRFFRLVRSQATFLQSCLCFKFFSRIRSSALKVICFAYSTFSIDTFVQNLAFDSPEQAISFLRAFRMELDAADPNWINTRDGKFIFMSGGDAPHPEELPYFGCVWIESKSIGSSLPQILCNNPTATAPSKLGSAPINSFNPDSNAYVQDPVLDVIFEEHEIRSQINNGLQQIGSNSQKSPQQQLAMASSKQQKQPPFTFGASPLFGTQSLIRPQQPSLLQEFSFAKAFQPSLFHSPPKIVPTNLAAMEFSKAQSDPLLDRIVLENLTSIGRRQLDKAVHVKLGQIGARLRRNWLCQYVRRWILFVKKRRHLRIAQRMTEELLDQTIVDQMTQHSILAYRKAHQLQRQQLAESIAMEQSSKMLERIVGELLNSCACRVQANQVRDIQQRLERIRDNLFNQWLRQFTDHWLAVVRRSRLLRSITTMHTPDSPSEARLSSPTKRFYHPELKKLTPEMMKEMADRKMRQTEEAERRKIEAEEAQRKRKAEEENGCYNEEQEDELDDDGEFNWSHLSIFSKRLKLSQR